METRHTGNRSLRSGGSARRAPLLKQRAKSKPAKQLPAKGRTRGSRSADADKTDSADESPSRASTTSRDDSPKPATQHTSRAESRPSLSNELNMKKPKIHDNAFGLTLRGRSRHNLKSRVDWSQNVQLSPDEPPNSPSGDRDSTNAVVSTRARSTESQVSPAAKAQESPLSTSRTKRLSLAGRSRQNSPSQSPLAQNKTTTPAKVDTNDLNKQTPKSKAQAPEDVKKLSRGQGLRSAQGENSPKDTPASQLLAGRSTRSHSFPKSQELENKALRRGKEVKNTPPARLLRASSNSPVTKTRGRQPKATKESTVSTPVVDGPNNSNSAEAGDAEGDADSVTRPLCSSTSSPESDHNYAKLEVAVKPSSSKVVVIGKYNRTEGPNGEAGQGSVDPSDEDDLVMEMGIEGGMCQRVLRGHFKSPDVASQTTVAGKMEDGPVKGFGSKSPSHAGKIASLEKQVVSTLKTGVKKSTPVKEKNESPLKVKRTTGNLNSPSNKVHKPFLKSLRQRPRSSHVLQLIKSTLSQEAKSRKFRLLSQAKDKTKSSLKAKSPVKSDQDTMPPLVKSAQKRPGRNLFEEFSQTKLPGVRASGPAQGNQDMEKHDCKSPDKTTTVTKQNSNNETDKDVTMVKRSTSKIRKENATPDHNEKPQFLTARHTRSKTDNQQDSQTKHDLDNDKTNDTDNVSTEKKELESSRVSRRILLRGSRQALTENIHTEPKDGKSEKTTKTSRDLKSILPNPTNPPLHPTDKQTPKETKLSSLSKEVGEPDPQTDEFLKHLASKSSVGYQEPSHSLNGQTAETVTVSEDGSDRKYSSRRLRGWKPCDIQAEPPLQSDLPTKTSLSRRSLQKAEKSISQGPDGILVEKGPTEADVKISEGESSDGEEVEPVKVCRGRAKSSHRSKQNTTSSLPVRELRETGDRLSRRSLRNLASATQEQDGVKAAEGDNKPNAESSQAEIDSKSHQNVVDQDNSKDIETVQIQSEATHVESEDNELHIKSKPTQEESKDSEVQVQSKQTQEESKAGEVQIQSKHTQKESKDNEPRMKSKPREEESRDSELKILSKTTDEESQDVEDPKNEADDQQDTPTESDATIKEPRRRGRPPKRKVASQVAPVAKKNKMEMSTDQTSQTQTDMTLDAQTQKTVDKKTQIEITEESEVAKPDATLCVSDKPSLEGSMGCQEDEVLSPKKDDKDVSNCESPRPHTDKTDLVKPANTDLKRCCGRPKRTVRSPASKLQMEVFKETKTADATNQPIVEKKLEPPVQNVQPMQAKELEPDSLQQLVAEATPEGDTSQLSTDTTPEQVIPEQVAPQQVVVQTEEEKVCKNSVEETDSKSTEGLMSPPDALPDQRKRARGRPRKYSAPGAAPTIAKKDSPIQGPPKWKIPPPSPIKTRRLSKEATSRDKTEERDTGIQVSSITAVQLGSTDNPTQSTATELLVQGTQSHTDPSVEALSSQADVQVAAKPDEETPTEAATQVESAEVVEKPSDPPLPESSSIQKEADTETQYDIGNDQFISVVAVNQPTIKETSVTDIIASKSTDTPFSPQDTKPILPPQCSKSAAIMTMEDSNRSISTSEAQKIKSEEQPSQNMKEAVCNIKGQVGQSSNTSQQTKKVDDLQVPFHDTDEAEQSEILSKKAKSEASEVEEGEGLKLYLEVESNNSDDAKDITIVNEEKNVKSSNAKVSAVTIDTPDESSPASDNVFLETKTVETTEIALTPSVLDANVDNTQREDTEVESILANTVGQAQYRNKDESGPPLENSVENSPSKSEWCARKVTTGTKIVLKLKRKGSSERSEGSSPSTPTLPDQKPKTKAVTPTSHDNNQVKVHSVQSSVVNAVAATNIPQLALTEDSPNSDANAKKKKRRRNELEMLNVIDRVKKKENDISAPTTDSIESENSGFTSDSTLVTQSSISEKEAALKSLDSQIDVKEEPSDESKVQVPTTISSSEVKDTKLEEAKQKSDDGSEVKAEQKVEKLVIKRRIPSPTKMKTRGKQNRLWYLFAKQSKSKELFIPSVTKETKSAPTGTIQELKAMCKPCSVKLVDIIECLDMLSAETPPQNLEQEIDNSSSNMLLEPPIIETRPMGPQASEDQSVDTLPKAVSLKRTIPPTADPPSKVPPAWSSDEASPPAPKKPRIKAGSEYETQYLSFVMNKATPSPVLERIPPKDIVKKVAPKPVLTRAPVTARKSMKSGNNVPQVPVSSPAQLSLNIPNVGSGLHQDQGPTQTVGSPGKFACLHCPYTSNVRSVMLEHVYIHTDIVPYACGLCNEAYGSRNGVVIHTKREHPGSIPDIVKNTEICEEDYYITCDTSKRTSHEPSQAAAVVLPPSTSLISHPVSHPKPMDTQSSSLAQTSLLNSSKSVSLLNPALLTAQVAASLGQTPVSNAPVQLVVSTSRPAATAPIVNVVAQVDPTANNFQVLSPVKPQSKDSGTVDCGKKLKIPKRPRIPSLVNVDPSQPYYQCRHCTFANNSLLNIKAHVEQHKGEQRYQCHRCTELVFCKDTGSLEKHYRKHHPGEQIAFNLEALFYDVHQGGDKARQLSESTAAGFQNRGQSPLHVIVSSEGVTLLGATDVSPASSLTSPHSSPPTVQSARLPSPAHSRPHPVLSSTSHLVGQGTTPPPAHSGSPSPNTQQSEKPGPASSKVSPNSANRVILKVPTISPPQRSPGQNSQAKSTSGKRQSSVTPVQATAAALQKSPVLKLSPPSNELSLGLDLSKKPTVDRHIPEVTTVSMEVENTESVADVSIDATDFSSTATVPDVSADYQPGQNGSEHESSPPPLMIMNVVSLAGQEDSDLIPDEGRPSKPAESDSTAEPEPTETFACTSCDATFSELESVLSHVGEVHKLQYWYSCPYCPFGCSRKKMQLHICRSHSDKPADVSINISEEEKYFIRHNVALGSQGSKASLVPAASVLNEEASTITAVSPPKDSEQNQNIAVVTGTMIDSTEPKTSEKGCSTDDIPCKEPPAPSRVVDEDDIVIVAEHRKQRPVGQIRPTMVRPTSEVQGMRRLGPKSTGPQQVQAVSPITISPEKTKPLVSDLEMECETIEEPSQEEEVTEDDDVMVTETQSSVITIPGMDQPLDLHQPSCQPEDEPTDLSVVRPAAQATLFSDDQPQDLSLTPKDLSSTPTNLSKPASAMSSDSKASGARDLSAIRSPPPAHQSSRRSVPPLVIEPIPSPSGSGISPWGSPVIIAPIPQASPKDTPIRTPPPAHSHKRNPHSLSPKLGVLSAHVGTSATQRSASGSMNRVEAATSRSSVPHRPVSKTMPPMMAHQGDKAHMKSSPATHIGPSHAKPSKNSTSVIQPLPSSSQSSALTSLEQMMKRSGTELGKKPQQAVKKLIDDIYPTEEAARKAYSVFNLKPKIQLPKPAAMGSAQQAQQQKSFTPVGINKWRQFQSQNRPLHRPPGSKALRPGFPGAQPGSLGLAAAAFQQAHMRRTGANHPGPSVSHVSSATATAAAASFMQRQPSPATSSSFANSRDKTPNIPCPYCTFEAEDADTIHNHILSHAPNIEWSCPYCPMPNYMSKASLTKHMQNCHPNSPVLYIPYGVPIM